MLDARARNGAVVLTDARTLETDLRTELEQARRRLLDLSARNALLNVRLGAARPSKNYLRIVDAVPEVVFEQLVREGRALAIEPVPAPDLEDGETPALEPLASEEEEEAAEEEGGAVSRAAASPNQIHAEEQARRLGIPTSFDLPEMILPRDQSLREAHQRRDVLRALLYQRNLEAVLKTLITTNKTRIEEAGISTLYAVFGFLEWKDASGANSSCYAPLLLVPIRINRGAIDGRGGGAPFSLEYSGDEIEINITLREKLRQLANLALPDLGEEEGPESYFARVAALIEKQPGWRVRRQIVLANLSFHKLRIWQDLDPAAWGPGELLGHPIVRQLFLGAQPEANFSSRDYCLDDPEVERELPPLIYDADSSQHSALIDALQGKNLVIEGPPGTGKSQTITNLIAAAMAAGKTVLFVAEKATALGIVQKKLAAAGLGEFCLSLGVKSDGGGGDGVRILLNTKDVAADLKQRMAKSGKYVAPTMLAAKKQALREARQQLIEYVETINRRFGGCGRTIQQIIGARERLIAELGPERRLLEGIALPAAEELTLLQVERMTQAAEVYSLSLRRVLEAGEFRAHPWFGFSRGPGDLREEQELLDGLRALLHPVAAIDERLDRLRHEGRLDLRGEGFSLHELPALEPMLPAPPPGLRADLLAPLSDPRCRARVLNFGAHLAEYGELEERLRDEFGDVPALDADELQILRKACAEAAQLDAASMTIGELRKLIRWIDSFVRFLERARGLQAEVERHLGFASAFEAGWFALLGRALELLEEAPWGAMAHRHPIFEHEGIAAPIRRAGAEAERLRALADAIARRVDWNLAPARELLTRHAVACANAGLLSFIDADFRRARRDWRGMSTLRRKPTPELMAEDYRSLIQYFEELKAFSTNAEWQEAFGPFFNGLKTPFAEYAQLAVWYEAARARLGAGSETAMQLSQALFGAPLGNLQSLLGLKRARAADFEQMQKIFGNFPAILARLPQALQDEAQGDLGAFAERLRAFSQRLAAIAALFAEFGMEAEIPLSQLPASLDLVERFRALRVRIECDREVAAVLGEDALRPDMNFAEVEEALGFIDRLALSSLPAGLRRWLLSEEIEARTAMLGDALRALAEDLAAFQRAKTAFLQHPGADPRAWFLDDLFAPGIDLRRMQARLRAALAATAEMPAWFAYQRARETLAEMGFADLVEMAEDGGIACEALPAAVRFIYQHSLLRQAFDTFPRLAQFDGLAHDETRRRFAEIDREVIALTREEIARRIDQREIPLGNGIGRVADYTNLGLLQHLVETPSMRLKIRQLVARAGEALLALKPCFMMSPLSVAQYLPPGKVRFDLVVMDEASQLKPEDALGAVARGADGDGADAESILEMASRRYPPPRMLKWHYRSQHESLIAFSNREFYGNQLIVFPSSRPASGEFGVRFIPVPEGRYEQNRNLPEAEQAVAHLIDHLIASPHESIGIVALNLKQRELIENLLELRLDENPAAEKRYREWEQAGAEVFVKNLESVQGDERDVILLSATLGRDAAGDFKLTSLGALNNSRYGHRRLNVLITRARKRVVVFSSIDPGEIQPSQTGSWGQRAFKDYLAFAKTGILEQPRDSVHEPDSEFEIMVADAIRKRGYEVVPQVGVASYRLDLAIRHPQLPGAYILGVEGDGAAYHSSRSARDRDRLRQSVLEGLGWQIHRIWSTDWFRNPEREIDRVVRRIETLQRPGTA